MLVLLETISDVLTVSDPELSDSPDITEASDPSRLEVERKCQEDNPRKQLNESLRVGCSSLFCVWHACMLFDKRSIGRKGATGTRILHVCQSLSE